MSNFHLSAIPYELKIMRGPMSTIPVVLDSLDPENPNHELLRFLGSMLIVVVTTRHVVAPCQDVARSLKDYSEHRSGYRSLKKNDDQTALKYIKEKYANIILFEIGTLKRMIKTTQEEEQQK